jgi:hypothetical protein
MLRLLLDPNNYTSSSIRLTTTYRRISLNIERASQLSFDVTWSAQIPGHIFEDVTRAIINLK